RVQPPGVLEDVRRGLEQSADRPPAAVVDEDVDRTELAPDALVRRHDLRLDRRVALDRNGDAAAGADLPGDLLDDVGAAGDERDAVARGESPGERGAESFADADDDRHAFRALSGHVGIRWPASFAESRGSRNGEGLATDRTRDPGLGGWCCPGKSRLPRPRA